MKDRVYNGFLAGFLATFGPLVFNVSAKALNLSTFLWSDYMGRFIMGREPEGTFQLIFFIIAQFVFMGVLGAIFAFILPYISSKHLILKGVIYGVTSWYTLLSIPYLLQIPGIKNAPFKTIISHLMGVTIWGILLSLILQRIDKRISLQ